MLKEHPGSQVSDRQRDLGRHSLHIEGPLAHPGAPQQLGGARPRRYNGRHAAGF